MTAPPQAETQLQQQRACAATDPAKAMGNRGLLGTPPLGICWPNNFLLGLLPSFIPSFPFLAPFLPCLSFLAFEEHTHPVLSPFHSHWFSFPSLSVSPSLYLSISLSCYLSIYLPTYPSIYQIDRSIYLFVSLFQT